MQTKNYRMRALPLAMLFFPLLGTGLPRASERSVRVGEPVPDFAVTSLDGRSDIRLSDFRGRRVLIFTWATW